MSSTPMTPELLELVAERFKVLGEPARLAMLNVLRGREMTVSDLVEATGFGQANVSKHLQILLSHGFVSRRKDGLFAYYSVADRSVFRLCDVMCGRLESQADALQRVVQAR